MNVGAQRVAFLERFDAVVRDRPRSCAIEDADESLNYSQLWWRIQAAAAELHGAGVVPGDRVLLEVGRSAAWVVGALASWTLGAAFVPLPPSVPPARRRLIAASVRARASVDRPAAYRAALRANEATPSSQPLVAGYGVARPNDLAYILYTSGSTGAPKGVMVAHRGIVPMLDDQIRAFELGPGDRAAWCLSSAFDASISDVGVALLSGATLVVADSTEELLGFVRKRSITHLDLPPSLLTLMDPRDAPASLRTIVIGGEPCPPATVRAWAERLRVVNVYGPTEATVCCSLVVCDRSWKRPDIGRAIGAAELQLQGEELWIGGDCVALGYWDDPAQTRERFQHGRFRTGDRVRQHDDGGLEFLGRIDRQRKVRGNLVCPEEIESRLLEHSAVLSARVEIGEDGNILAVFECRVDPPPGAEELRAHLAESLPSYMIPHRFCSGEVPRAANSKPISGQILSARVGALWSRVLGCAVGPEDTFLSIGGDSLSALRVSVAAAAEGLTLSPELLLDRATPRRTADALLTGPQVPYRSAARLRELATPSSVELDRLAAASLASSAEVSTVLLTGATGRLGRQVLIQILAQTDWRIVCLVRGGGRGLTGPRVSERSGDLENLDDALVDELARDVDAVVHCAARVNMAAPYESLAPVNVAGTRALARLATLGRRLPIHYASTLSVFVATDRNHGALRASDHLDQTREVYGGYAQTKYVAERFLRELGDHGLPVTLHRFGLLVQAASAETPDSREDEFLAAFVRGVCALGCLPSAGRDLAVDITPVEFAARAMVELLSSAQSDAVRTFHIANRKPATLADLAASLARAGVELAWVDDQTWRRRALGATGGSLEAAAVLGACRALDPSSFRAYRSFDLFQATDVSFEPDCLDALSSTMPPGPALLDPLIAEIVAGL